MNKLRTFFSNEKYYTVFIPCFAVIMGFLVGVIVMLITGLNPKYIFTALLRAVLGINTAAIGTGKTVFNPRYIGEFFVTVMPLVLTGLSVAFAFRTGLFNIGAEGQLLVGSLCATVTAILARGLPSFILLPMVVLAGALAGGIWGFIPGILKARFNVHEVVGTIMLNYTGLYLSNYVLKTLPGSDLVRTAAIPEQASLQSSWLSALTNGSRLHWGFIIVIAALISFWFIINKTTFGYELRAVGYNPFASKYAGIKVQRNAALSMGIAGVYSGLAGVLIAVGTFSYGRVLPGFENYGFDGLVVALVGGNTALGTLLAGLLLGSLHAAQPLMQSNGIPRDISIIIVSAIIIFVAMQNGIKFFLNHLSRSAQ